VGFILRISASSNAVNNHKNGELIMSSKRFQVMSIVGLLAIAFTVCCVQAEDARYIPIKGNAWRLALADINGDGKKELIYGSFEGAVRCIDPQADGKLLWEQPVGGGFVFALAARDVTGDGRAETFAAVTDGYIYAFGPDGKLLWRFETVLPQWGLDVGAPQKGGKPVVVCGGVDKKLHVLDAASGTQIAETTEIGRHVDWVVCADFDGDGADEAVVVESAITATGESLALFKLTDGSLRKLWSRPMTVPESTTIGESYWGSYRGGRKEILFRASALAAGDLSNDGKAEVVGGDCFYNQKAVAAYSSTGQWLWNSRSSYQEKFTDANSLENGHDYFGTAWVRIAEVNPTSPGPEVISVATNYVRIHSARGELLGIARSKLGFSDLVVQGRTLYLGSSPNGDNTIYRVDLGGDWRAAVAGLEPRGVQRQVRDNLARLREQVLAYKGKASKPVRPYSLLIDGPYATHRDWAREKIPYEGLVRVVTGVGDSENRSELGLDGKPLKNWAKPDGTLEGGISADQLVEKARKIEDAKEPTYFLCGGGTMPAIRMETAERMMQAAPNYLIGWWTGEDE
jgi:hypothetical protein